MAVLVECVGDDTCELVYIIGWSDCGDECFRRIYYMNILVYIYIYIYICVCVWYNVLD